MMQRIPTEFNIPKPLFAMLTTYMTAAMEILPMRYTSNCAIAATRITKECLEHLHLKVRPLETCVRVMNQAMIRHSNAAGRLPNDADEAVKWSKEDGSWSVGIGYPDPKAALEERPNHYSGHLIAIINDAVMIDLSICQVNRKKRDIQIPPLIAPVEPIFLIGTVGLAIPVNGCEVLYEAYPELTNYTSAPDWSDKARHKDTISDILYAMRKMRG